MYMNCDGNWELTRNVKEDFPRPEHLLHCGEDESLMPWLADDVDSSQMLILNMGDSDPNKKDLDKLSRLMENVNNITGNDVVDPNAQIITSDGDHQLPLNPNAQVLVPDGGQPLVGHVPSGHVPWGRMPWGHIIVGQFQVPLGQNNGIQTPVTTVPHVAPTHHVAPAHPVVPAAHAEKPEKFNGSNFKRWQQKMLFYLTTLYLDRYLKEEVPLLTAESDMQTVYAADA
ncbi:hypothetical protein AgCh_020363 [Apium graveolens]